MLAISTAWNYKEDKKAEIILEEIKETGLDTIELGYRITVSQLKDILELLPQMNMEVSSVHNFCPLPNDGANPRHPSNYYRLSAKDEEERSRAVLWTKKAIDTAKKVKAKVVVIHAGCVQAQDERSLRLYNLYRDGKNDSSEFKAERENILNFRKKNQPIFFDALMKSLNDVMNYAQGQGIYIGLETRYYPLEIPNYAEIGILLDKFHKAGMYYWHDVGHAQVSERLGITPHVDFLKSYALKMVGAHIHGVKLLRDHLAPLSGDFDIQPILPYFKGNMIKVIESHSCATAEEIKAAAQKLSAL